MAMNATDLKDEILALLTAKGFDVENEFSRAADLMDAIANGIVTHLINNMEIKGVTIALDGPPAQTVETFAAGVGTEGGSLIAAGPPGAPLISGTIKHGFTQNMSGTQSNDGTGRVA